MSAGSRRSRRIEDMPGLRSLCHGMSRPEPAAEPTPPLLIIGPYSAAQREAHARGLTTRQWRHVVRVDQAQGVARGSRYVRVGPLDRSQLGRLAEIVDVLRAYDAVKEGSVI